MTVRDAFGTREESFLGKGVSEEKIKEAEEALELKFAADYVEYLSTVGLAMCDGHEFTGIGKEKRTNVVDVTRQMKELQGDIPNDWYVIENENMDGAAMWQDGKGNVYFNKKIEYKSLIEYIQDLD